VDGPRGGPSPEEAATASSASDIRPAPDGRRLLGAPCPGPPLVRVTAAIDAAPPGECYLNLAALSTAAVTGAGAQLVLDLNMVATTGLGRPTAQRVTVLGDEARRVLDVLRRVAEAQD
jgi:hypothetical protein